MPCARPRRSTAGPPIHLEWRPAPWLACSRARSLNGRRTTMALPAAMVRRCRRIVSPWNSAGNAIVGDPSSPPAPHHAGNPCRGSPYPLCPLTIAPWKTSPCPSDLPECTHHPACGSSPYSLHPLTLSAGEPQKRWLDGKSMVFNLSKRFFFNQHSSRRAGA